MKHIIDLKNKIAKDIELTEKEKLEIKLQNEQWILEKPMNDWLAEMQTFDSKMPRHLEDTIDAKGIDGYPKYVIDKYNEKKLIRAKKPEGVKND